MAHYPVRVPRNFKLLDEYECAIGKMEKTLLTPKHHGLIQYGLVDQDDIMMHNWQGIIIGPQGKQIGELMYEISIFIPDSYPDVPPVIRFKQPRIAMDCVGQDGTVDLRKIKPAFRWNGDKHNIADVLMAIRENMDDNDVCQKSIALADKTY